VNVGKIAVALVFAASAAAASATQQLPEGKWWKRPRVAAAVGLTTEQTRQIEGIFSRARPTLIDLKADLEKRQGELQDALDDSAADRSEIASQVEAVEDARAELQKARILMLLDMKQVLKPEQWNRLVRLHEAARRQRGQRTDRFGDRRRPPPN
jgi:Spy/CpxP family protein refolding chaperone